MRDKLDAKEFEKMKEEAKLNEKYQTKIEVSKKKQDAK